MRNTTPTCLKCIKIAYSVSNGASLEEIKALFTAQEMITKVINKSYDSIPHLSMSRVGPSDSHIDAKSEALLTEKLPDIVCALYIEEKMDGSNCAVIRKNGEIIPIGRAGYRCIDSNFEQHRRFHKYVIDRKDMFEKLLPDEGDRVVGEWLAMAHGTIYKNVQHPYQVFDLFAGNRRLSRGERISRFLEHGLQPVPLLYAGHQAMSVEDAMAEALRFNPDAEGIVYRLEILNKKSNQYVPHIIAKVVRVDKEDGKYLDGEPIWLWEDK